MIVLLQMSVSAAVLIALILIVRALFLDKLPKRLFKFLWAVAAARMLIPFSLPIIPQQNAENSAYTVYVSTAEKQSAQTSGVSDTADKKVDIGSVLEAVWICGAAAAFAFFAISHRRGTLRYKTALPCRDSLIRDMVGSFGIKRKITVRISDEISSPLTYGVIRPTILLPERMAGMSRTQLEFVLAHEITHIKKHDVAYKWFLTAAVCVHWFNPMAWIMLFMADRDIELVCDEAVLKTRGDVRKDYALTLIEMEEKRTPAFCAGFGSSSVKERIVTIMKFKRTTIVGIAASICLAAGSMAVFAAENDNAPTAAETDVIETSSAEELPETEVKDETENAEPENDEYATEEKTFTIDEDLDGEPIIAESVDGEKVNVELEEVDINAELEKSGILCDENGNYTYNGKDVAGLISESAGDLFVISNPEAEDGVYLSVTDSGAEEISKDEFDSKFSFDDNGEITYEYSYTATEISAY